MSCYLSWQWKQYNGSDIKSGIPRWTESCRMIFKDFVRIINSCIIKKTNSWLAAKWTCFFDVLSPMLQDVPTLYWILSQHCWVISQIRISIISRSRRLLPIKNRGTWWAPWMLMNRELYYRLQYYIAKGKC